MWGPAVLFCSQQGRSALRRPPSWREPGSGRMTTLGLTVPPDGGLWGTLVPRQLYSLCSHWSQQWPHMAGPGWAGLGWRERERSSAVAVMGGAGGRYQRPVRMLWDRSKGPWEADGTGRDPGEMSPSGEKLSQGTGELQTGGTRACPGTGLLPHQVGGWGSPPLCLHFPTWQALCKDRHALQEDAEFPRAAAEAVR